MDETFKDTVTLTFSDSDDKVSELRNVPGAPGLKWSLHVYPKGISNTSSYIEVNVRVVGGDATVNATIDGNNCYNGSKYNKTFQFDINDGDERGCNDLCPNDYVILGYTHTITCTATFKRTDNLIPLMLHELVDESKPHCFDAKITIGESDIKVHRGFLAMISPVFSAMFNPETKESKTGVINITDFSVATVKNALDYCFGVNLGRKTATEVVDMLRFYDKYDIQPAMTKLDAWLNAHLTVKNFAAIATFAWQYSRQGLQADCGRMFHNNVKDIVCLPDFVILDPAIIAAVVQSAYLSTGATLPDAVSSSSAL